MKRAQRAAAESDARRAPGGCRDLGGSPGGGSAERQLGVGCGGDVLRRSHGGH